ncbi:MAG: hypothetical protein A3E01_06600 [Gammaproteobacteria bacterium RIFCSPHIGHO2_12_FULL_63_22]|nr:MAG: hypothetical protein A3E01_06600 [Gammaproteobacteria bacterium RIFCSPHIGHO2_12_FULL_63_22]
MSKKIMTGEDAGPSVEDKSLEEAKKRFLKRAIPFMLAKFYRAEALGVDWENTMLEHLDAHIILAEEFAKPTEYVEDWQS